MKKTLKVLAVEGRLVPHFGKHRAGVLEFVGQKKITENGVTKFAPTGEPIEVPASPEMKHYLQRGDLLPARVGSA